MFNPWIGFFTSQVIPVPKNDRATLLSLRKRQERNCAIVLRKLALCLGSTNRGIFTIGEIIPNKKKRSPCRAGFRIFFSGKVVEIVVRKDLIIRKNMSNCFFWWKKLPHFFCWKNHPPKSQRKLSTPTRKGMDLVKAVELLEPGPLDQASGVWIARV